MGGGDVAGAKSAGKSISVERILGFVDCAIDGRKIDNWLAKCWSYYTAFIKL